MIIVDRISQLPNGAPVDAGTPVLLRREIDGTVLDTQLTDINGWVTFQANGSPGPVYTEVTIGSETRYRYGRAVSQVGSWYEGEWQSFMDMVQPGVIMSMDPSALKVIPGTGIQVQVSPGSAMAEGILGRYYDPQSFLLASNGSGNPRNDLVVMNLHSDGAQLGRVEIIVHQGTPAATPVDPVLPSLPGIAQLVLARVRVQSGVSVILASDITDLRQTASFVPDGSITTAKLADDSVTPAKLDRAYAAPVHTHTIANVTGLQSAIDGKANSSHTHDDRYFTESEINTKLDGKAAASHNHSGANITSGTVPLARMPQITAAYLAADSVGQSELAANAVTSGHIVDGTIAEGDLSTAVKNKLNAAPAIPSIGVERNTTKTNYASASTLTTSTRSLAAGTYIWWAHGTIRCTGEASSQLVKGWLRILRAGSEINAEPFHTTADAYGVSVDVMAGGSFSHGGGSMPIVLDWTRDSGTMTTNSRQLFTFVQKVA